MEPKVSIIIPTYNYGRYVAQAAGSALAQTYKNFEVICVDDKSTDNTQEVLRRFGDQIRILKLDVNSGSPVIPRNLGANYSEGELLLFLDADDMIDHHYLEKTVPLMTQDTGVVATWIEMFGSSTEKVGSSNSSYPIFAPTQEQILMGNSLPICSLIRKKTFYDAVGYDVDAPLGSEDWLLWATIVCLTDWKIKVLPEYLFYYRVHPESLSRRMPPFEQTRQKIKEKFSGS